MILWGGIAVNAVLVIIVKHVALTAALVHRYGQSGLGIVDGLAGIAVPETADFQILQADDIVTVFGDKGASCA